MEIKVGEVYGIKDNFVKIIHKEIAFAMCWYPYVGVIVESPEHTVRLGDSTGGTGCFNEEGDFSSANSNIVRGRLREIVKFNTDVEAAKKLIARAKEQLEAAEARLKDVDVA